MWPNNQVCPLFRSFLRSLICHRLVIAIHGLSLCQRAWKGSLTWAHFRPLLRKEEGRASRGQLAVSARLCPATPAEELPKGCTVSRYKVVRLQAQLLRAERLLVLHNHPDWSHQTPQAHSSPDPSASSRGSAALLRQPAVCPRAVRSRR